jgi:hypothetical protein
MAAIAPTALDLIALDGSKPERFQIIDTTPEGSATSRYSVWADYGWASRCVCEGCYEKDAKAIGIALAVVCDAAVEFA